MGIEKSVSRRSTAGARAQGSATPSRVRMCDTIGYTVSDAGEQSQEYLVRETDVHSGRIVPIDPLFQLTSTRFGCAR